MERQSETGRDHLTRHAPRVVTFLLLGACATVAVTLACALFFPIPRSFRAWHFTHNSDIGWQFEQADGFGVTQVRAVANKVIAPGATDRSSDGVGPYWTWMGDPDAQRRMFNEPREPWHLQVAFGWPMRSGVANWKMYSRLADGSFDVNADFAVTSGVQMPKRFLGVPLPDRVLPVRPIVLGFAVNTMLYGSLMWLSWLMIRWIPDGRRWLRTRRGLCARCKYDLRGELDAGCPECGWRRSSS